MPAPISGSMLMNTPALAAPTRAEPNCQAAVATRVESTPWPTMPAQAAPLRSSRGGPCMTSAIGRMVRAAMTTVTAGIAIGLAVLGARRRTSSQARKISRAISDRATPNGEEPASGLPAIRAAPRVAAATPAQEARLTRSPRIRAETAISAGMAPTSRAARVTLTWARPSNWTMKATP